MFQKIFCGYCKRNGSFILRFRSKPENEDYQSFGVTAAEVEYDVITGERQILQVDIVFDCGIRLVIGLVGVVLKDIVIGAGGLGLVSQAGQIGHGFADGSPPLRCFCVARR